MRIRDALPEEMDEAAAVLGAAYGEIGTDGAHGVRARPRVRLQAFAVDRGRGVQVGSLSWGRE